MDPQLLQQLMQLIQQYSGGQMGGSGFKPQSGFGALMNSASQKAFGAPQGGGAPSNAQLPSVSQPYAQAAQQFLHPNLSQRMKANPVTFQNLQTHGASMEHPVG